MYLSKFATRILRTAAENQLPYDVSEVVQITLDDLVQDGLLVPYDSDTRPYRATEAGLTFLAS